MRIAGRARSRSPRWAPLAFQRMTASEISRATSSPAPTAERAKNLPEYAEHNGMLQDAREQAERLTAKAPGR